MSRSNTPSALPSFSAVQIYQTLVLVQLLVAAFFLIRRRPGATTPAILLYLSYFLLLSAARSAIDSGRLPHWPGMFLVPLIYLLLIGVPLNLQGTSWWNGVKGHFFKGKSA